MFSTIEVRRAGGRLQQPRLGEAQLEAVQIDFQGWGRNGIHGRNATCARRQWL